MILCMVLLKFHHVVLQANGEVPCGTTNAYGGLDACDGAYVAQHRWPEVLSMWYSKNTLFFSCKLAFIFQRIFF